MFTIFARDSNCVFAESLMILGYVGVEPDNVPGDMGVPFVSVPVGRASDDELTLSGLLLAGVPSLKELRRTVLTTDACRGALTLADSIFCRLTARLRVCCAAAWCV